MAELASQLTRVCAAVVPEVIEFSVRRRPGFSSRPSGPRLRQFSGDTFRSHPLLRKGLQVTRLLPPAGLERRPADYETIRVKSICDYLLVFGPFWAVVVPGRADKPGVLLLLTAEQMQAEPGDGVELQSPPDLQDHKTVVSRDRDSTAVFAHRSTCRLVTRTA